MVMFHDDILHQERGFFIFYFFLIWLTVIKLEQLIGWRATLTQHSATYERVEIVDGIVKLIMGDNFKLMNRHNFSAIMVIIAKERNYVTLLPSPPCILRPLCRIMSEREIFTSVQFYSMKNSSIWNLVVSQ